MPKFVKCAKLMSSINYMRDPLLSVPIYYTLFRRPSKILVEKLNTIRGRLRLPRLKAGVEPAAGAWALRTPRYYILALHFRMVPLGFEPLSVEINADGNVFRMNILGNFWEAAEKFAESAEQLAECRGEKLLIYFATDSVKTLRPEAMRRLSGYGKVVFGLLEGEVGHVSPQWTVRDEENIRREVEKKVSASDGGVGSEVHEVSVEKSEAAVEMHGIMSMVEW
jgi:hypothetical protein